MKKLLLISLFFIANALSVFGQSIIYVDADAGGANDGTSWTDAFDNLQDALGEAGGSNEIWIAQGTYYPDEGSDRSASFTITGDQDGLKIYGGFENGDADLEDRNPGDHPVILSGDIGRTDDTDNSYHVLVIDGTSGGTITNATVLDGVTVTAGNGNGSSPDNRAGGLYCIGNGAGNECSPTIINVVFADNFGAAGGAIYNFGDAGISSPNIINSVFTGNNATVLSGTAVVNNGNNGGESSPNFTNTTITGNSGGIYNSASGGGTSEPQITNTILWDNGAEIGNNGGAPDITYSLVADAQSGTGNINSNPFFINASDPDGADDIFGTADDGFRLYVGSPALNAATNSAPDLPTNDITGAARIQDGTADMGAYEGVREGSLIAPLAITTLRPLSGISGKTIAVNGKGFDPDIEDNTVEFISSGGNATTAVVTEVSTKRLEVTVPEVGGGNYFIKVTRASDSLSFESPESFAVLTGGGNFGAVNSSYQHLVKRLEYSHRTSVSAGDINRDGMIDLVSAGVDTDIIYDKNDVIFEGGTEGFLAFGAYSIINFPFGEEPTIELADMNSDGYLDVVYADGSLSWAEFNPGNQYSYTIRTIPGAVGAEHIDVVDMDNDGDMDVLTVGGDLSWFENNGNQNFTKHTITDHDGYQAFATDMDGDGDLDILVADGDLKWYENENMNFSPRTIATRSDQVNRISVTYPADLDGDGDIDVISSDKGFGGQEIFWYENDGQGSFTEHLIIADYDGYAFHAADMDADGDTDIIMAIRNRGVGILEAEAGLYIFENQGDKTFIPRLIADSRVTDGLNESGNNNDIIEIKSLFTADINNDGTLDIMANLRESGALGWFKNPADSRVAPPVTEGQAVSFSSGKVTAPNNAVYEGLNALTVEAWLYFNSNGRQGIIEKHNPSQNGWWIDFDSDITTLITTPDGSRSVDSEINPQLNQWYHFAVTYDGTVLRMYLDGNLVGENDYETESIPINNKTFSLTMGDLNWTSANLDGLMDEVRIWNKAVTEEEIRQNMFQKLNGDEAGLIAYYPFDEEGEIALDKTVNKNQGSLDSGVSKSEETHPYGTFITGSEGWRMMSAPVEGATYGETLDPLWTQGFPGSDTPNNVASNVLKWDEPAQSFTSISDADEVPAAGSGFITFVYEDDNFDGNPDDFPKEIRSDNGQVSGAVNPALSFTDSGTLADDGWNLLGNPYGATIDWDAESGWTTSNLDASFYLWNAEDDEYQSWNGTTGTLDSEGLIAPWQGFWVKANTADPELTFTDEIRSAGGFLRKEQATPELRFTISDGQLASDAIVMFSEESAAGKDRLDAYKLASLNEEYLSLFTELEDGAALDINALPAELEESVSIPLNVDGNVTSEEFELSWKREALPEDWQFTLRDNETGQEFDLMEQSSITIKSGKAKSSKISETLDDSGEQKPLSPQHQVLSPKVMKAKSEDGPRFTLTITSAQAVTNEQLSELPTSVELQQNYPNPFNPTTTIQYGVPEAGEVSLEVFDMLGRKVATLINRESKSAGRHTVQFDAARFSSGMYIYRLKAANTVVTKKLTLIK
ncbi:MAG: LamG-like jellyroll fold domain-containing protein [Gracilimonas sp.]